MRSKFHSQLAKICLVLWAMSMVAGSVLFTIQNRLWMEVVLFNLFALTQFAVQALPLKDKRKEYYDRIPCTPVG